jgi:hypothetical protein
MALRDSMQQTHDELCMTVDTLERLNATTEGTPYQHNVHDSSR